jgi:predicted nucleotidyltransferase
MNCGSAERERRRKVPALSASQTDQVQRTISALRKTLGPALRAVFLHGSAVTTGLRPESDIDLLAMIDRPLSDQERRALLADLLQLSPALPGAADDPRRLEVMIFRTSPRGLQDYPAEVEFIYGEWLRKDFEAGSLPMPGRNAENTLILAQAGRNAEVLFGEATGQLPEIPAEDIRTALGDALPQLIEGLRGDERNVLLTLARIWWTASSGAFVSKDAAAAWAAPLLPPLERHCLDLARGAYLGLVVDIWDQRQDAARQTAEHLRDRALQLL